MVERNPEPRTLTPEPARPEAGFGFRAVQHAQVERIDRRRTRPGVLEIGRAARRARRETNPEPRTLTPEPARPEAGFGFRAVQHAQVERIDRRRTRPGVLESNLSGQTARRETNPEPRTLTPEPARPEAGFGFRAVQHAQVERIDRRRTRPGVL